ncbi:MAG TPA: PAS domain S-box protein, partial [Azospirillaceae bacterium]|nr:PAS domain S-box protein [Azospirillaceae bacterium]
MSDAQLRDRPSGQPDVSGTGGPTPIDGNWQGEAFVRSILDSSPDCIKVLSLEGDVVYMNGRGLCVMEIDDFASVCGGAWSSFWPAAARPLVQAAMEKALAGGEGRFQAFCPTAKSTPKWWDVVVTGVPGPDGRPERLVAISRDITAERRREEALRRSEERFRSLVEATSAIVWNMPASGEFTTEQPAWSAFTGQSFEQLKGWGWLDAVHPEDRAATAAAWRRALETITVYEVQHRLRQRYGAYRTMSVRAVPMVDDDGMITEWVGIHTDVTDRQAVEAERRMLAAVIEQSADFVGVADTRFHAVYVNDAGRRLVGLETLEEALRTDVQQYFVPEDVPRLTSEVFPTVLRYGRWSGRLTFRHFRTGARIPVIYDVFRVDDPATGEPTHYATLTKRVE